jgi:hypothetical protein
MDRMYSVPFDRGMANALLRDLPEDDEDDDEDDEDEKRDDDDNEEDEEGYSE